MTDSLKSNESSRTKYAAPEAVRLGNAGAASGSDCLSGSAAHSRCSVAGNNAEACITGNGTFGKGACDVGNNAANCSATGNTANGQAGCHSGNGVV